GYVRLQQPAHAEHQIVRLDVVERHRAQWIAADDGRIEVDEQTALGVAEVQVPIGQIDRKVRRHLVGQARMQRPGEVALGSRVGPAAAASDDVGIAEMLDLVVGHADARADERRHAPPGPEIQIAVDEDDPLRLGGPIVIVLKRRYRAEGIEEPIEGAESDLAAILAGHVEPQPVVPGVAETAAEEHRSWSGGSRATANRRRATARRSAVQSLSSSSLPMWC